MPIGVHGIPLEITIADLNTVPWERGVAQTGIQVIISFDESRTRNFESIGGKNIRNNRRGRNAGVERGVQNRHRGTAARYPERVRTVETRKRVVGKGSTIET